MFCRFVFGALWRISHAKTLTRERISLARSSVKENCKFLLPRERISENSFADPSAQEFILPPRVFFGLKNVTDLGWGFFLIQN